MVKRNSENYLSHHRISFPWRIAKWSRDVSRKGMTSR